MTSPDDDLAGRVAALASTVDELTEFFLDLRQKVDDLQKQVAALEARRKSR